jgi:hypothetical protein
MLECVGAFGFDVMTFGLARAATTASTSVGGFADDAARAASGSADDASRVAAGSVDDAARSGTGTLDDVVGAACSFASETGVLMANGTVRVISEIRVGDKVLAMDPATGERGARAVTHLWVHSDTLVELGIGASVVTTTEDHPFWNHTDSEWQRADALDPGDHVLAADGTLLLVGEMNASAERTADAYNLTVDDIHTYFIATESQTALVHNDCIKVPGLDGTGKVHGDLPSTVPPEWAADDLVDLADDLETSIAVRRAENSRLGVDYAHSRRIAQEEALLRQVRKRLSGS